MSGKGRARPRADSGPGENPSRIPIFGSPSEVYPTNKKGSSEADGDETRDDRSTAITTDIGNLTLSEPERRANENPLRNIESQIGNMTEQEMDILLNSLMKRLGRRNDPPTAPPAERLSASFLSAGGVERQYSSEFPLQPPTIRNELYSPYNRSERNLVPTTTDSRRFWKTSEVGYFWPDMPSSSGTGRYIDLGEKGRAFRDVNAFVSRFVDQIPYMGKECVRNNVHNCLRGSAFAWYNDILPEQTKVDLRSDISEKCQRWQDILLENFKLSGAEAMKKIISPSTTYTTHNLRRGESISSWFMDMMSLATDAGLGADQQKINFAWHKLDNEIRRALRAPQTTDTVQGFLQELRRCEEGLRESFAEQERRVMQVAQFAVRQGHPARPLPTTIQTQDQRDRMQTWRQRPFGVNSSQRETPAGVNQGRFPGANYTPGIPKRPCRWCKGQHYDSMCTQRDQHTAQPRGQAGNDAQAFFTVDKTGDVEYDQDHQDAMDGFFSVTQGSLDDYEVFCEEMARKDDWVDCGHFQEDTDKKDSTAVVLRNAPQSQTNELVFTIHHGNTYSGELFYCGTCGHAERTRNRLFTHLRQKGHLRANFVGEKALCDTRMAHLVIPRIVQSNAPKIPGNGYAFRDYNFLEMAVRVAPGTEDLWVCLDTGCGVSLIDSSWIREILPDAAILNRPSAVNVRGLGDAVHSSNQYMVLQLSLPGKDDKGEEVVAQINREFHLVPNLGCKVLIGTDVIVPEKFLIDAANNVVIIGECESVRAPLRVTPRGRPVIHRVVKTSKTTIVKPFSQKFIPVKFQEIEEGRDYEFTPKYSKATAWLAASGGFVRHVVDAHLTAVVYHNRTNHPVKIEKNIKVGVLDDFQPISFHARLDVGVNKGFVSCAEDGEWDEEAIDIEDKGAVLPVTPSTPVVGNTLLKQVRHAKTAERKSKYGLESINFNEQDRISLSELAVLKSLTNKYRGVFQDRGSVVNEPEEDWMVINLKPEAKLESRGPYRVSDKDKEVIDQTFDRMHKEGKMDWGIGGPVGWPVFVVWNKGSGRVVVDIRGLNQSSWSDSYPLSRQEDIIACARRMDWITTLDLSQAFLQRRLAKESRWLTTVVTHRGQEVFTVTPMGYKNSPAHMQRYMERLLRSHKQYARCFIDDITIFSETFELHVKHIEKILEVLDRALIYLTASKCFIGFHGARVLGRFVDRFGLSTIEEKTLAIQQMKFPESLSALETFIGMVGYYQPHIPYYSALVGPLEDLKTSLLKPAPKGGKERKRYVSATKTIVPTKSQAESFRLLQEALSGKATLAHFDRSVPLFVNIDASKEWGYGVSVSQLPIYSMGKLSIEDVTSCNHDRTLEKPICYISKKLNSHEKNYWPTELEVACLVWAVRKIRHLVEEAVITIIFTDHKATVDIVKQTNLTHVTAQKQNLRLVRASLFLSQFDKMDIRHVPGRQNIAADALSRLQSASKEDALNDDVYEALQAEAVMVRISDDLIDKFQEGYQSDPFFRSKFNNLKRRFFAAGDRAKSHEYQNLVLEDAEDNTFITGTEEKPRDPADKRFLLYLKDNGGVLRLCIPRNLQGSYLQMAHDRHNHAGVERTYNRLRQNYFIKNMSKAIKEYVEHCPSCITNNTNRHKPYGTLHPVTSPSHPWELVTMDFVVALPPSSPTLHIWKDCLPPLPLYDAVLTITDKFTKSIRLLAGKTVWGVKDWAEAYFDYIYPVMGVPGGIISDRGSIFLSAFWTTLFGLMNTNCIATTAYNPQADGQSERTNQTMEIALRHLVNGRQDNWVDFLGQVQIEHNNATNASTGKSPNELLLLAIPNTIIDLAAPKRIEISRTV